MLLLSQHKTSFETIGTKVFISAEDKIKICRDKRTTAEFFDEIGLLSPVPVDDYKKYNGGFPAFIKPKDGSSSVANESRKQAARRPRPPLPRAASGS